MVEARMVNIIESTPGERPQPKSSWIGRELGAEYLRIHGVKEARKALRFYLSRALQSDGNLAMDIDGVPTFQRMTEGHSSDLAWYFTEVLTHKDVFNREKRFLTFQQHELIMLRHAERMSIEEIEEKTGLAPRTIHDGLRRAIDRMMPLVFGD